MIVFGGYRDGALDDLWTYRPAENRWLRLDSAGQRPPARYRHSAVWQESRQQMLIFGGMRDDPLADLWRYSPYTNTWLQLLPDGERPPPFPALRSPLSALRFPPSSFRLHPSSFILPPSAF